MVQLRVWRAGRPVCRLDLVGCAVRRAARTDNNHADVVIDLTLPFPPSVNRYWRNVSGKTLISEQGRAYRKHVSASVYAQRPPLGLTQRLAVDIVALMPDRRRRDLDNLLKATLDALQHAGVYEDDSQIDDLRIVRGQGHAPGGELVVQIREVAPC